jgi:cell shape-determining protein MreC
MDDISFEQIGRLTYELELAHLANRQMLNDFDDLRNENDRLRKECARLEAKLRKAEGDKND